MYSDPYGKWVEEVRFGGSHREGTELPPSHTEGLTDITPENAARKVYGDERVFGPGLQQAWNELTPDQDSQRAFIEAYSRYYRDPEQLHQEQPARHDFMQKHVFFGSGYAGRFDVPDAVSEKGNPVVSDSSGNLKDRNTGEDLSKY